MKNILYIIFVITLASSELSGKDFGQHKKTSGPNSPANRELISAASTPGSGYISGDAFNLGFSGLFRKYVNRDGLVNYAKLRRMRGELFMAERRLNKLKPEVYITWSKKDKIAFWINAYNICTLDGIIKNYPIKPSRFKLLFYPADSVIHISGLTDKTYFDIMGLQYTLNEIERDILLGRFAKPRACLAINYGTMGSAALRNEPYLGKYLEKQLNDQAKKFFSNSTAFRIDISRKIVYLSPLLKMYQWREDFFIRYFASRKMFREYDDPEKAFLNFASEYISRANADLLKRSRFSVEYIKYNWALNEAEEE